jgi:L-2,4-diaminobutyrate decarboxylase
MITRVRKTFHSIFFRSRKKRHDLFSQNEINLSNYNTLLTQSIQYVTSHIRSVTQPFSGTKPEELRPVVCGIDLSIPLNDLEPVLKELDEVYTKHAIYFHRPEYIAHLNCPVLIPALAAEVIISAINSSLDTWDQSAGGTLIEQKLIRWTCDQLFMSEKADGVFTSGGTQSNLMALLLARDHYLVSQLNWDIKKDGLPQQARRFKIFCSGKSHFSLRKSCNILGLGENVLVEVPVDEHFRMDTAALEAAIITEMANGNIPIAVAATAGTTDFGSIDPVYEIHRITEKYKLWLHVDAAYGCGLMLSDKHRHLLKGTQYANSVTVDYHKAFFQPVSSSAILINDSRWFNLITYHADYLNPREQDKQGWPNQVNKSIQTTRRFDALKLWFTLRMTGRDRLGTYIDTLIETAQKAADLIDKDKDLELLNRSEISTILFRYRPFSSPLISLNAVNTYIRKRLYETGVALVASTRVDGATYLKFTILNPETNSQDIRKILNLIKSYGNEYALQN